MDQLFVNERLPSPSPSTSTHSVEAEDAVETNVAATPITSQSARQGKQPEPRKATDGPKLSYAEYRARRKSSLAVPIRPNEDTQSLDEDTAAANIHVQRDGRERRPTLSNRSTEESDASRHALQNQGLLWNASTASSPARSPNADLYTTEDGPGVRGNASRRSPERPSDSGRSQVPRRYSRPSRPYSYAGGTDQDNALLHTTVSRLVGATSGQIFERESSSPEVVVPRWQPDAEVTFCPICKTQFSFFVRKHHCRKCGRVVCNACSPHRITIPHQYIVQPPTDSSTTASRPSMDAARARSSTIVESLGGGERVRLCNPCVPDPNIAPPQTRSEGQPISGHSRSQSTVPFSPPRRADLDIPNYRARDGGRDSGIDAQLARDRYWAATGARQPGPGSYGPRSDSLSRPDALESRSRSSTVGSTRVISQSGQDTPRNDGSANFARSYHAQAHLSRPLPSTPQPQRHTTQRRRIREEDQCWLCFRELPSRDLPDSEALRSAHVMACLEAATLRASGSPVRTAASSPAPPPPPPQPPLSQTPQPIQAQTTHQRQPSTTPVLAPPQPQTSRPIPTQAQLSTPESRMLARERQHAAIVLGQSASPGPSSATAMSRVIPYIASEKDGIDDAECMICMEEFEVGQEMGRLECFCRFHLGCIRGWFERKAGKCPVHGGDFF